MRMLSMMKLKIVTMEPVADYMDGSVTFFELLSNVICGKNHNEFVS